MLDSNYYCCIIIVVAVTSPCHRRFQSHSLPWIVPQTVNPSLQREESSLPPQDLLFPSLTLPYSSQSWHWTPVVTMVTQQLFPAPFFITHFWFWGWNQGLIFPAFLTSIHSHVTPLWPKRWKQKSAEKLLVNFCVPDNKNLPTLIVDVMVRVVAAILWSWGNSHDHESQHSKGLWGRKTKNLGHQMSLDQYLKLPSSRFCVMWEK